MSNEMTKYEEKMTEYKQEMIKYEEKKTEYEQYRQNLFKFYQKYRIHPFNEEELKEIREMEIEEKRKKK